ncbi:ribosomal RNA processing protein [Hymenopellis radicata]|nr:ribosomal RNA processing protein [Hymenopellis radicata]
MSTSSSTPPLGKYLASTEKKVRDKAIKNLSTFLSDSEDALPPPEMAKLWKGIFYCFWMSDKPLVQQALATELAELILTITSTPASLTFLDGFWETTVREWSGIDRLRIDKYYMLVRRFVNAGFRLLIRTGWDLEAVEEYNRILTREGGPLCPGDIKVPTSLIYHLADIYLQELDNAMSKPSTDSTTRPAPLCGLVSPFLTVASRTPISTTYNRIQTALLTPLLSELSSEDRPPVAKRVRLEPGASDGTYRHLLSNACASCGDQDKLDEPILRGRLLRQIFNAASDPETRGSNRRKMYDLWKDGGEADSDEA